MREQKYRVWDGEKMYYPEKITFTNGLVTHILTKELRIEFGEECEIISLEFTGLHDKNGKEIYEGDIVKCSFWTIGEKDGIQYHEKNLVGEVTYLDFQGRYSVVYGDDYMVTLELGAIEKEVIGNIYENKDLLEVKP